MTIIWSDGGDGSRLAPNDLNREEIGMSTVRWGVIGNAKIGRDRLQPAIEASAHGELVAVASRSGDLSYEALLARDDIDAVYIPLPNHLHVEWSRKALEAGKHVLCEKSITLSPQELEPLMDVRPDLILSEAFMVRFHPQWVKVRELVQNGVIGEARAISGQFSFYNVDPKNVRNQPNMGGGGILDIGCYPIFTARFVWGAEPIKGASLIVEQDDFGTDIQCSAIMEFPDNRHLNFVCSTQLQLHQRMVIQGTKGRIEVKVPFNPYPGIAEPELYLYEGASLGDEHGQRVAIEHVDQYVLEVDAMNRAILGQEEWSVSRTEIMAQAKAIAMVFDGRI